MTIHAITQYLRYKWKAMGRHGIHSPFAYAFVEDVLQDRGKRFNNMEAYPAYPWLGVKYAKLLTRMTSYYGYTDLLTAPADKSTLKDKYDMLLFKPEDPRQWGLLMDEYCYLLKNNSMVLIPAIHKTGAHTAAWHGLCMNARVRMSIDVYGAGLLLFKMEFRERQHFVLGY